MGSKATIGAEGAEAERPSGWRERLGAIVLEPRHSANDPATRREVRLLAALLLAIVPLTMIGAIASSTQQPRVSIMLGMTAVFLAACYALSRTRHFRLGAALAAIAVTLTPFESVLASGRFNANNVIRTFVFLLVGLIFSTIFMSMRSFMALALSSMVGMLMLPLVSSVSFSAVFTPFSVIFPTACILAIGIRHRDLIERDRRREIEARNEDLVAAHDQLELRVSERTRELSEINEQLERARQDAEAASLTKSEFLANMSHELRTPMNGVLGMLGLLLDTKLTDLQREYTETSRGSGMALLDVINDILDLSKVEAGKMTLEPVDFDLRSAIEDVMDQFTPSAADKGLELITDYPQETPAHIVGDPGRIRQLLINIIGNSVKFTNEGHVLVTVREVEGLSTTLQIAVEDTGIGIPTVDHAGIFEKFKQVDSSSTRRHTGTGLGLAITQQLVLLMGGRLELRSTEGEGSTFTITLPLEIGQAPPHPPPPANLEQIRVLVVDDHPVNRRVLTQLLTGWNMRNDGCASGTEAIARLCSAKDAGDPYNIAVIDYQMPEMNGIQVARAIGQLPAPIRDTVMVLLTSVALSEANKTLDDAGCHGYLIKPIHQSALMDVLATAWSGHLHQQPRRLVTRHSVHARSDDANPPMDEAASIRVLVVEDNIVNQKVATKMLMNLGCFVDVAANGREGVEMVEVIDYDIVFMDIQMPEMDGYEATAEIRRREGAGQRLFIVAMTARAMAGDKELCLSAGMDDYISKPVGPNDLQRAIGAYRAQPEATPSTPPLPPRSKTLLDRARFHQITEGDPEFEHRLLSVFIAEADKLVHDLRAATQDRDWERFRAEVHSLKGQSGNVGFIDLHQLLRRIEQTEEPEALINGLAEIDFELERIRALVSSGELN